MPEQPHAGSQSAHPGAQPSGKARPLRRNRDFMLLWTGQVVFATRSSMTTVVYALLALAATHSATLAGAAPRSISARRSAWGALGGILGALAAPALNKRLSPAALVYLFGWTCCVALALLGQPQNTYLIGALLAVMFLVATPANATLFAAQIDITPPELQGRVVSTAMLAAGIAAPAGPPLAGLLLDSARQAPTFFLFAALAATLTIVMHLSTPVRTMHRAGTGPQPPGSSAAESRA